MTAQSPNAGLDQAAEEYAYNPDTPTCRSGIRGETSVDPEEAFKAGARWQAALAPPQADHALVEARWQPMSRVPKHGRRVYFLERSGKASIGYANPELSRSLYLAWWPLPDHGIDAAHPSLREGRK